MNLLAQRSFSIAMFLTSVLSRRVLRIILVTLICISPKVVSAEWLDRPMQDLLIAVDENGPQPLNATMKIRQGVLFFYNATQDSMLTLELNFGEKALTCFSSSSENMSFREGGVLASTRPIGPGGFATTCFPKFGTYNYTIYGLERFPAGLNGTIEVRF